MELLNQMDGFDQTTNVKAHMPPQAHDWHLHRRAYLSWRRVRLPNVSCTLPLAAVIVSALEAGLRDWRVPESITSCRAGHNAHSRCCSNPVLAPLQSASMRLSNLTIIMSFVFLARGAETWDGRGARR